MKSCYQARVKSLLHSLFHISCPFFLELVVASAILNCPQLIQPANAKLPSQQQSILLSQSTAKDLLRQGTKFYVDKRYQEAFESYDKATQLEPNNPSCWNARGMALSNLNKHQEAFKSYDKATQLKPDAALYWTNRGFTLRLLKRYQEAFESYDKVAQLEPNDYYSWIYRGDALYHLKKYQESFESFDKAHKLIPESRVFLYFRARSLIAQGKNQEAIANLNDISTEDNSAWYVPKIFSSRVWHLRGIAYMNLGEFQNALIQFDKAISLDDYYNVRESRSLSLGPEDSWYGKGSALVNLQRYPEALTAFNKAIELKPDFPSAIKARDQLRKLI